MIYVSVVLGVVGLVAFCYFARRTIRAIEGIEPSFRATFQDDFPLLTAAIESLPSRIVVEPSITVEVAAPDVVLPDSLPPTIEVSAPIVNLPESEIVVNVPEQNIVVNCPEPIVNVTVPPLEQPAINVSLTIPDEVKPRSGVYSEWDERAARKAKEAE
jgi:hypothetical protein